MPGIPSSRNVACLLLGLAAGVAQAAGTRPMCELMKPQEIKAIAPFTLPFVKAEGWPLTSSPGGCRYVFKAADGSDQATVAIGVTRPGSTADARSAFDQHASAHRDLWQKEIESVAGLGDAASFGGEDRTGLKIIQKSLVIDINLGGQYPDVSDAQKKAASLALGKLLLERVSQLKMP
ncbi:MAG: hypothetical protein V4650_04990 [Pseudomonadota bacterium]